MSSKQNLNKKIHIYSKVNGLCHYCDKPITFEEMTKEHIVPKSKGGTKKLSNMALACIKCNRKRGNENYLYFLAKTIFQE